MTCNYQYSIPGEETPHIVSCFMDALRLTWEMYGNQMRWCMFVTSKLKRSQPEDCELVMSGPHGKTPTSNKEGLLFQTLNVTISRKSFSPRPCLAAPHSPPPDKQMLGNFSKNSKNMKGKIQVRDNNEAFCDKLLWIKTVVFTFNFHVLLKKFALRDLKICF